jgi:RNA polymerase sigma-70 factor, ECF subfamily
MTHGLGAEDHWSELMAAAQQGDGRAYDQLLREIVPFIRAIAMRQHGARDRADEVVQEVLLTVHRVRHTYDPARPFRRWLAAIARRRSIDALRCRCRYAGVELNGDSVGLAYESYADPATHRLDEAHANADCLGKAISSLPALQREAVELLKLRELSLAEASRLTGRSIEALKVNVHRALKSLRKQLQTAV